jgi:competence protein ComGA
LLNAVQNKKIFTLEDPVEVVNEKYVQIQINEKQHMSYADGIKQLMRHDPDIIMIGEIRDETAAKMAVRCALTGHLVVSTIHSFSCVSTILRMLDLGVEKYQLKDVLKGISSQRLFEKANGEKTGIYEYMNEKEITYYFEKGDVSDAFIPLSKQIEQALFQNEITYEQAKEYIA